MKSVFIIIILLLSMNIYSKNTRDEYVRDYTNNLTIAPYIASYALTLEVKPKDDGDHKTEYKPNIYGNAGVAFSYLGFGASISTKIPKDPKDSQIYGDSKYFDFQINYYSKSYGIDVSLQEYSGFYANNAVDFNPSWVEGDAYPQRSDLKVSSIGVNFYFIDNENLSLRSSFNFSEKQLKSAGSLLLLGSVNINDIKSNSSLIPSIHSQYYGDYAGVKSAGFLTLSCIPGYGYTLVLFDDFFLTGVFALGPGIESQSFETNEGKKESVVVSLKVNVRLSIGYNGENFYSGIMLFLDSVRHSKKEIDIGTSTSSLMIKAGYRF